MKKIKPFLSITLCLTLLFSSLPVTVWAEAGAGSEIGLCQHHPAHTEECGYVPAQEEVPCDMGCTDTDGDGIIDHAEGCAYTPAAAGQPCGYICELCAENAEGAQESAAPEGSSLPETGGDTGNGLPPDDGWTAVQALIDALPTVEALPAMTEEEQQATYLQAQEAREAYEALTPEQQEQVAGAEALDSLLAWFDSLAEPEAGGADANLAEHIIDTVSPAHVTFNLFDYWLTRQDETGVTGSGHIQDGINRGHTFLFYPGPSYGPWNLWTGNPNHFNANQPDLTHIKFGIYPGIVASNLQDGYPVLSRRRL